jgi:hypothetical protein
VAVVGTPAVEADTSEAEVRISAAAVRILGAAPASAVERGILAGAHASAVEARVFIPEVSAFHRSERVNLK